VGRIIDADALAPWHQNMPECDAEIGGTPPAEIEADLSQLRALMHRFTSQPSSFQWPPHPIFGKMSQREWMRWGYLHSDHHLRQFGS
jgi:hypothetical protein